MKRFLECRQGNIAVVFALSMVPVLGAAGMAVDYARAYNAKSFAQNQADRAVLFGVQVGQAGDTSPFIEDFRSAMRSRYGAETWVDAMEIEGNWLPSGEFSVEARAQVPVTLLAAVPGMRDTVPVAVVSTARQVDPRWIYNAPTVSELDYEAGDYNRISVYCFDYKKFEAGASRKESRGDLVPIADNGGTDFEFEMPMCLDGQVLSYKLLNVRLVRTQPHLWDDPGAARFEFYTDTTVADNGSERYDISCEGSKHCNPRPAQGWNILETVLCKTEAECTPKSEGGIIPEGNNRNPQQASQGCEPGKYMYYGWEDRPPGMKGPAGNWQDIAWTDRDYDDIRIVIGCPSREKEGEQIVRLTR